MTNPEMKTIQRQGSRWYIDPRTGQKVVGVTSVLRMLPKPFLAPWSAKLVATEAVEQLGAITSLVMGGDKEAAIDMLKRTPNRTSGAAADIGTQVHEIADVLNKGGNPGLVHPDIEPWVNQYRQFLDDWQPTFHATEATVWSDKHEYAGTVDAFATVQGDCLVMDLKTGKSIYEEVSLQLSAYRFADYQLSPDGTETPIPDVVAGAAIHVRPDSYSVVPVRVDEDLFEVFRSLIAVHKWDSELKRGVLGAPINPEQE